MSKRADAVQIRKMPTVAASDNAVAAVARRSLVEIKVQIRQSSPTQLCSNPWEKETARKRKRMAKSTIAAKARIITDLFISLASLSLICDIIIA